MSTKKKQTKSTAPQVSTDAAEPPARGPAPADKLYNVPPEIGMALSTGRPQFVGMLVKPIQTGARSLTPEETASVVDLLRDVMEDKNNLKDKIEQLEQQLYAERYKITLAMRALQGVSVSMRNGIPAFQENEDEPQQAEG